MTVSAPPPNAAASCWTRWRWRSRNSKAPRARTKRRRAGGDRTKRPCVPSCAPSRCARRFRSICRASGSSAGADQLPLLRRQAHQAGRERHRDAGGDPAAVEGDTDGAREVHLPVVREDHAAAGAVPCDRARLGRPEPAGDDAVREVRQASAAEPAGRALCPRRHRLERIDAGRSGRCLHGDADAAGRADQGAMCLPPSACMATTPRCRCWPRTRPSPAGYGPMCATTGRSADRRRRRQCSSTRAIAAASIRAGISRAMPASCRPTPMLDSTSSTSRLASPVTITEAAVLGACAAQAVRARRCRQGAAGDRGGAPHRCAVRDRARHQRPRTAQRRAIRQVRVAPLVG